MKKYLLIIALVIPTVSWAENSSLNLALPSAPNAYGQDSFKSGEMDCKNAIGGSTQFEFGVTGIIDNYESPFRSSTGNSTKDIGVYARITVPLDAPKERVNCNTLYQLELKRKRLEIMKLETELNRLRALQGGDTQ